MRCCTDPKLNFTGDCTRLRHAKMSFTGEPFSSVSKHILEDFWLSYTCPSWKIFVHPREWYTSAVKFSCQVKNLVLFELSLNFTMVNLLLLSFKAIQHSGIDDVKPPSSSLCS